jgi:hypothetical protein
MFITLRKGGNLMRKFKTFCGGTIVVPRKAEDHLRAHPNVDLLMPESIARVQLPRNGAFLSAEVEIGRVVGRSGCVQTPPITQSDRVLFAQRIGRDHPSRVIVGEGEKTTKVVVLAFASHEEADTYVLVTSWVGSLAPKEPWDSNIRKDEEYQECLRFWCANALVWDPSVMSEPFKSSWEEILR